MSDLVDELPWMEGAPAAVTCSEGWDDLIRRLHNRMVGIDPGYRAVQVKEKFGGLRFYVVFSEGLDQMLRDRAYEFIREAAEESYRTCEVCGEPGELNDGPWYRTLCEVHERLRQEQYAALAATAGDDTEDIEVLQEELRLARREVARRRDQ